MSKEEEILKSKWTYDSDPGRFTLSEQVIFPAMREYAREMSIGFVGWIIQEGYEVHSMDVFMKINDTGVSRIVNRDRLYDLYLDHLSSLNKGK
jgi:hypothetical protein